MTEDKFKDQKIFNHQSLIQALSKKLNKEVLGATFNIKMLHGGTVGEVHLIKGLATSEFNTVESYEIVLKKQKKWERYGDVNSWRREYDLYNSTLYQEFLDDFSWPACYLAKIAEDSFEIWMEYIDGYSGNSLTLKMYQKAAEALGRLQGKLYNTKHKSIKQIDNLSIKDYVRNFYEHYQTWDEVHNYIRSNECELAEHICQMIIDLDSRKEKVYENLEQLPIVLCHRDYWNTNIFYLDDKIFAIDWDTAGYGYFGEDIASLIADETDPSKMLDYFHVCIPAYQKGFSEYANIKVDAYQSIYDMILMLFGYRLVETFKFAKNDNDKNIAKESLQSMYEMKNIIALN